MNIPIKLFSGLTVLILLLWGIVFFVSHRSSHDLQAAIEDASKKQVYSIMHEIDRLMQTRIANWIAFVKTHEIQRELEKSNRQFEDIEDVNDYIDTIDKWWREAGKTRSNIAIMDELTAKHLSLDLSLHLDHLENSHGYKVFGEALITNRYGANAGQSNATSDYRQDDEEWWQLAKQKSLHVANPEFDESAEIDSVDICVRVDNNAGEMIGVLKASLNIKQLISIIEEFQASSEGVKARQIILFDKERRVIYRTRHDNVPPGDGSQYFTPDFAEKARKPAFVVDATDPSSGNPVMRVYATSQAFGEFGNLGWALMLENDSRAILEPVADMKQDILVVALIGTIIAILFGSFLAYSISSRIRRLTEATDKISHCDMGIRVGLKGNDELAKLSQSFDIMVDRLEHAQDEVKNSAAEVARKNIDLLKEIEERKRAEKARLELETRLRQKHKLEAVGQLAAGLAHEINTPLQFVTSNTQFLQNCLHDISNVLEECQKNTVAASQECRERSNKLRSLYDEVDIAYMLGEIPISIIQSLEGLSRIAQIVRSMKEFSDPGGAEKQVVNINEAIRNTILVSSNEWESFADIETDLASHVEVFCDKGEISQIFLNIIINAVHAIKKMDFAHNHNCKGKILFRTRKLEDAVEIRIEDNGMGMRKDVQTKVFDPFFTTKDVGSGSGQGLNLAYRYIVNELAGTIDIESEEGLGTGLIIRIPTQVI